MAVVLVVVEMLTLTVAVGMLGVAAQSRRASPHSDYPFLPNFRVYGYRDNQVLLIRPIVRRHMLRPSSSVSAYRHWLVSPPTSCQRCPGLTAGFASVVSAVRSGLRPYDQTLVIPAGAIVDVLEINGTTALVYPRE
jgi:hypothetical protein